MYISLYRKWRPKTFAEVVGQEHVARTLANQIKNNTVSHAYLFSGPRGTGKTSVAKILAQALNCAKGPTVSPCGVCQSCQAAREGVSMDVIEIDAASNRRIDDVRELRDNTLYAPAKGHHKVYIIDEVHMMTTEAFNAFLKLLEEPPAHVIFVLATTEPNRVPATISSRCQCFDFRPLARDQIINRLKQVAQAEKINFEEEALTLIAEKAGGSLRDALSSLEQVATCLDNKLETKEVVKFLGLIEDEIIMQAAASLIKQDTEALMNTIAKVATFGYDLRQFAYALLKHFRNLLVCTVVKDEKKQKALIFATEQRLKLLNQQAKSLREQKIKDCLDVLNGLVNQLKFAFEPRLELEVALIKLTCQPGRSQMLLSANEDGQQIKEPSSKATVFTSKEASVDISENRSASQQYERFNASNVETGLSAMPRPVSLENRAKASGWDSSATSEPSGTLSKAQASKLSSDEEILNAVISRWSYLTNHSKFSLRSYFKSCRPVSVGNDTLTVEFIAKPLEKIAEQIKSYLIKELADIEVKKIEIVERSTAPSETELLDEPSSLAAKPVSEVDLLTELGAKIIEVEGTENNDKIS